MQGEGGPLASVPLDLPVSPPTAPQPRLLEPIDHGGSLKLREAESRAAALGIELAAAREHIARLQTENSRLRAAAGTTQRVGVLARHPPSPAAPEAALEAAPAVIPAVVPEGKRSDPVATLGPELVALVFLQLRGGEGGGAPGPGGGRLAGLGRCARVCSGWREASCQLLAFNPPCFPSECTARGLTVALQGWRWRMTASGALCSKKRGRCFLDWTDSMGCILFHGSVSSRRLDG